MKHFLLIIYFLSGIIYAQPNVLWTKQFGQDTLINSLLLTDDGGYITVGTIDQPINDDVLLYKINSLGIRQWTRRLGKLNPYYESGNNFTKTSDGGYAIVGQFFKGGPSPNFDILLMKSDSLGDTLWTRTYNQSSYDEGVMVKENIDGDYIILGNLSYNMGATSFPVVVKADSSGNNLWKKSFGYYSSTHEYAIGNSLLTTQDGGCLILVRARRAVTFIAETLIIKIDALGDTLWTKNLQVNCEGASMKKTSDGGYIIVGERYGSIFLSKTDSLCNTLWTNTFGQAGANETGEDIQQLPDDGYIIVGNIESSTLWLIRTDALGDTLWTSTYNLYRGLRIKSTLDGGYIILGILYDGSGYYGLMKTAPDITYVKRKSEPIIPQTTILWQNYPNPFNPKTSIRYSIRSNLDVSIKVYDLLGKEIATLVNEKKPAGAYTVEFDASKLSSGIYFYQLQADDFIETKKMMLMR